MPDDDAWKCGYCGKHSVVPSLARECERKHEDGTHPDDVQPKPEQQGVGQ